jgi:hypothetical protein
MVILRLGEGTDPVHEVERRRKALELERPL